MRETFAGLAVGVGATGAFELLNRYMKLLEGGWQVAALITVFIVPAAVGVALARKSSAARAQIASGNRSGAKFDATVGSDGFRNGQDIGSRNRSKGDMNISIGKKDGK